ncbi:MAG: hypothetical protein Alpg2KO_16660 [Alphaproteobacteria bacterium]
MRLEDFFGSEIQLGHAAGLKQRGKAMRSFFKKHGRMLAITAGAAAGTLALVGAFPALKAVTALAGVGLLIGPQLVRATTKITSALGINNRMLKQHDHAQVNHEIRKSMADHSDTFWGVRKMLGGIASYARNDLTSNDILHKRLPVTRKTTTALGLGITIALTGPIAPLLLRGMTGAAEFQSETIGNILAEADYRLNEKAKSQVEAPSL